MAIASFTVMTNWYRVESVLGETAREMGVLTVVFAPLEATFSEVSVSALWVITMIAFGLTSIVGGIIMETRK